MRCCFGPRSQNQRRPHMFVGVRSRYHRRLHKLWPRAHGTIDAPLLAPDICCVGSTLGWFIVGDTVRIEYGILFLLSFPSLGLHICKFVRLPMLLHKASKNLICQVIVPCSDRVVLFRQASKQLCPLRRLRQSKLWSFGVETRSLQKVRLCFDKHASNCILCAVCGGRNCCHLA